MAGSSSSLLGGARWVGGFTIRLGVVVNRSTIVSDAVLIATVTTRQNGKDLPVVLN